MRSNACRRRISRCRRRSAAATLTSPPSCGSCPRCAYTGAGARGPRCGPHGARAHARALPVRTRTRTRARWSAMHARFVSLQPLQHLDPTAHRGDVHSCRGAGLRARRPHRARGVAGSLKAAVFDPKEFIASLPRRPGVYRMFGAARELLYVGKARSLKDRVGTYFAAGNVHPKVQALTAQIDAIEVTVTNSETEEL